MHKDTLPAFPNKENQMEDEDVVYLEDEDEVIEPYDAGDTEDEDPAEEENTIEKGHSTCVFLGHKQGSVFCGTLSKDGKLAVTGGEDDKAYVWDTETGEIILDCTGHKDSVIFTEFNHNESYLATGDMSGLIQVWQMNDKVCIWDYNMGDATWMKWHMAANILLGGSVDGEIYMWKVPDADCKVFPGHGCRAEAGAILPDGKRLVVGYEDGTIRVIDLRTGSILAMVPSNLGHSATITALDCHSDNNLILSAAIDGKTILSTANTGKVICILQMLNAPQRSSTITDDQASGSSNGETNTNWVETAAFSKDPSFQVAVTGTIKGEIFIWDISKQILMRTLQQDRGISKLLWKGNTSILFSAGLDGALRCFDARTSRNVRSLLGHKADILDLYISENGEKALTTSDDSTARIFDISTLS